MSGNTNLSEVLKTIKIDSDITEYGYACINKLTDIDISRVIGLFVENEGLTVIAPKQYLESLNIPFEGPFAKLTINVHTSLDLVGLTATLATKLTENGISANVVAAYYHDHIFVQYHLREQATQAIIELRN